MRVRQRLDTLQVLSNGGGPTPLRELTVAARTLAVYFSQQADFTLPWKANWDR